MADEQPDEGRGYEPSENRHRAAADVQPHLHVLVFDQRQLWPQREPRTSIQENQDFYGQATACLQSLPQTDGGQTIHLGVPVQFPSGNRSTDPLQGISQTRPFGRVQDRQDDLPLMSNEGIYYPPRAGSRSPQDSRFHRGMEVESAGEASHDQSVNPTGMQSLPGEQTLPLAEGERPRQLSGWDDQQEREKSFENAPAIFNSNTQLSAKIMAENGFYFTGDGDCVRCFTCGVSLHAWKPHDDPLVEHVKHRLPEICLYAKYIAGQNLLSDIIRQVQHSENGKLSRDIDETACKQHIQDQLNLQQQQQQHMSAASGNTAVFQSSSEMSQTRDTPDVELGGMKANARTKISKKLEEQSLGEGPPVWSLLLDSEDLEISAKESSDLEKSSKPGKDFYDKLAQRGYTSRMLIDMLERNKCWDAAETVREQSLNK